MFHFHLMLDKQSLRMEKKTLVWPTENCASLHKKYSSSCCNDNHNIFNCGHLVSLDFSDQYLWKRFLLSFTYSNYNGIQILYSAVQILFVMLKEHPRRQKTSMLVCSEVGAAGLWVGPTEDAFSSSHLESGVILAQYFVRTSASKSQYISFSKSLFKILFPILLFHLFYLPSFQPFNSAHLWIWKQK